MGADEWALGESGLVVVTRIADTKPMAAETKTDTMSPTRRSFRTENPLQTAFRLPPE